MDSKISQEINNDSEFLNISKSDLSRVHTTVSKIGYSDGITDGRDKGFQEGFDNGYEDGFRVGFEMAKYKIFCQTIDDETIPRCIRSESRIFRDICSTEGVDKIQLEPISTTDNLVKIRERHLNRFKEHKKILNEKLPSVSNLFSL